MDALFEIEFNSFQFAVHEVLGQLYYLKQSPSEHLNPEEYVKAKQEVRGVIYNCDFDINKIGDFLSTCKQYDKDKVECFIKLLQELKTELLSAAFNHYNSAYGDTIMDFDWLLKCILGTSELKTLNYSLLQLSLALVDSNDCKTIMYEINKDKLLHIIHTLESIM